MKRCHKEHLQTGQEQIELTEFTSKRILYALEFFFEQIEKLADKDNEEGPNELLDSSSEKVAGDEEEEVMEKENDEFDEEQELRQKERKWSDEVQRLEQIEGTNTSLSTLILLDLTLSTILAPINYTTPFIPSE